MPVLYVLVGAWWFSTFLAGFAAGFVAKFIFDTFTRDWGIDNPAADDVSDKHLELHRPAQKPPHKATAPDDNCEKFRVESRELITRIVESTKAWNDAKDAESKQMAVDLMTHAASELKSFLMVIRTKLKGHDNKHYYRIMNACCTEIMQTELLELLHNPERYNSEAFTAQATWITECCVPHIWGF